MNQASTTETAQADAPFPDAPLAGIRVIELDAIGPVPFAGRQLRQLGAHVTRVHAPFARGLDLALAPDADLFDVGKATLALDLKSPDDLAALHDRLDRADVLLDGFRPGVLERLDLAPSVLRDRHPRLIVARLPGFGVRGPYAARAGHDINFLALSGALAAIGPPERPAIPLNLVADFGGGAMQLVTGVLAALVRRGTTGRGALVETSILGGTLALTPMLHAMIASGLWTDEREANLLDGGCPFYRLYATADERFVAVGALEPRFFEALLSVTDTRGRIDPQRQYERATWRTMQDALAEAFSNRTRDAWDETARAVDCCVTPVLDAREAMAHPQNRADGIVVDDPFPHPGSALRFDGDPPC